MLESLVYICTWQGPYTSRTLQSVPHLKGYKSRAHISNTAMMLKNLKLEQAICGDFVGAAAHADDLRTPSLPAAFRNSVQEQVNIITSSNHLQLITEIIKIIILLPST